MHPRVSSEKGFLAALERAFVEFVDPSTTVPSRPRALQMADRYLHSSTSTWRLSSTTVGADVGGDVVLSLPPELLTTHLSGDPGCSAQNWNGCDPQGGCDASNPRSFNPTNLNVSTWIESMLDINAEWGVLTAKHGCVASLPALRGWLSTTAALLRHPSIAPPALLSCGFLLWETNVTLPDGSPYGYNVNGSTQVMELFSAAARAAGLGYGWYYSLTNNFYLVRRGVQGSLRQPPATRALRSCDAHALLSCLLPQNEVGSRALSSLERTAPLPHAPCSLVCLQLGHSVRPPSTLLPGQANVTQAQYEGARLTLLLLLLVAPDMRRTFPSCYPAIALAQMSEIWNNFGDLTEVWLGKEGWRVG